MIFNSDRMLRLSGLSSRDEYTASLLREQVEEEDVEIEAGPMAGPGEELAAAEDAVDAALDDAEADVEGAQDALIDMATALGMEVVPAEEVEEVEEEVTVEEARLREAIRKEILAVLRETRTQEDEDAMADIRKSKSLVTAEDWARGTVHPKRKNKISLRGVGGTLAFGGPGFM